MRVRKFAICFALLCIAVIGQQKSPACPFCESGSALTLSEEVAAFDTAVIAKWVDAKEADEKSAGSTIYEVLEIVRQREVGPAELKRRASGSPRVTNDPLVGPASETSVIEVKARTPVDHRVRFQKADRITLDRHRAGKAGDLVLLIGMVNGSGEAIDWNAPKETTAAAFQYITKAPGPDVAGVDRLRYFVKYLEHSDETIAGDAYREFARAPYERIAELAKDIPRDAVRGWIGDPKTPQVRLGLYGLMLGLCGNADDARLLGGEKFKVAAPGDDFRLGIDGVMAGYLLLTGPKGLDLIDETVLRKRNATASDLFAALAALRFIWSSTQGVIEKDRLRASLRPVLDRPEFFEIVLPDLARWEDWSVQDRLMELYGTGEYNIPTIKRAIARYMIASIRYKSKASEPVPERVTKGKKHLQMLRERDPETVKDAERFSFSN